MDNDVAVLIVVFVVSSQETRDVQEQFNAYKDEMSDTSDTLEILTLDKEMAEEKVGFVQQLWLMFFQRIPQVDCVLCARDVIIICCCWHTQCESLQLELDSAREKLEELTLDLEILREEATPTAGDDGATVYQVKQLEKKNEQLKEILVK